MIITSLYLDNLYSFYDTTLDLTFKRPLTYNPILHEYLPNRPKFYVRRICILSGANASGKTSLGRLLFKIQSLISNPLILAHELSLCVYDKNKPTTLQIEFATLKDVPKLHRLNLTLNQGDVVGFEYQGVIINKNDSVGIARGKLTQEKAYTQVSTSWFDLAELIKPNLNQGWYYLFSENHNEHSGFEGLGYDIRVLKAVLQTFDNAIVDVLQSQDEKGANGFNIYFDNGDSILINNQGYSTRLERLSRGTYDAISVAHMLSWIMANSQTTSTNLYFLDEKMAFSHSELEQAILNLVIEKLSPYAQFFYTTHNYDVLDMNLPVHSYVFLYKEYGKSKFIQPESIFKKNDRTLLNYVKNNAFKTLPNTSKIDELL